MHRTVLIAALLAGLALPPQIRAENADQAGIEAVISQQIDAFRHDDSGTAFGYATPGLQQQFGSADRFMAMVRHGYAPVYRPQSYRFGTLSTENGRIVQRVELIGPDGHRATAIYTMERQADGSWRIAGCALVESPDLST